MISRDELSQKLRQNIELIASFGGRNAKLFVVAEETLLGASSDEDGEIDALHRAIAAIGTGSSAVDGELFWHREALHIGAQRKPADLYICSTLNNENLPAMIAHGLEADVAQQEVIESLSFELGNRYEELNLLYGIDDSLGGSTEESAETSIETVLNSCIDFLNIDGAAIHFPDHLLEMYRYCDIAAQTLLFSQSDSVGSTIRNRVRKLNGPLVINDTQDAALNGIDEELSFRVVAAPVYQGQQQITGLICFLRSLESEPFSTSDRKLAVVVASEISRTLDARYDAVTGLMKRAPFEKYVRKNWQDTAANDAIATLVQIDIDGFSLINDACGHDAGDRLLRQAARQIRHHAPRDSTVARLGPDEYGVFLPGIDSASAQRLAQAVVGLISGQRFVHNARSFDITVSIGITDLRADMHLTASLTECDIACHMAKELGGNRIRVYDTNDAPLQARHEQMQWASKLRSAVDEDRFELFAQAIKSTDDPFGPPAHLEVLLRLFDAEDTIVSPAIFIPAAERYGIIDRIDLMVVESALKLFSKYQQLGVDTGISINIAGPSLCNEDFLLAVIDAVKAANVRPDSLTFEITETAAIGNINFALGFIEALSDIGCRFSLDDFGSGMSSYAYLRQLPVDYVKIDGSFVKDIETDSFNRSIVESINQISHVSGKKTVAEFVETESTIALLADIGVDYLQGYAMDRPSPLEAKLSALVPAIASVG